MLQPTKGRLDAITNGETLMLRPTGETLMLRPTGGDFDATTNNGETLMLQPTTGRL